MSQALPSVGTNASPGASRERPASLQILVVDDSIAEALRLVRVFQRWGYDHVLTATTRGEALSRLEEHTFDLVLVDLHLSKGNGLEVVSWMRAHPHYAGVPVIALTGVAFHEDLLQAAEAGVNACVLKPIEFAGLKARIQKLVGEH